MKNEVLYAARKKAKMSLEEFSNYLELSVATYISYEDCKRIPRQKHMQKVMDKLSLKDPAVFFPELHIVDEENSGENVAQNICSYMNAMSRKRHYDIYEVSMIRRAVRAEYLMRRYKRNKISAKSEEGKKLVNKEIAEIANAYLNSKKITSKDVELFKRCKVFEYEKRKLDELEPIEEC